MPQEKSSKFWKWHYRKPFLNLSSWAALSAVRSSLTSAHSLSPITAAHRGRIVYFGYLDTSFLVVQGDGEWNTCLLLKNHIKNTQKGFLTFESLDFSSLLPNGTSYQLEEKETNMKKNLARRMKKKPCKYFQRKRLILHSIFPNTGSTFEPHSPHLQIW